MKTLLNILESGLLVSAGVFVIATLWVGLVSFADWEWLGYNWPVMRFFCGAGFLAGIVIAILHWLEDT